MALGTLQGTLITRFFYKEPFIRKPTSRRSKNSEKLKGLLLLKVKSLGNLIIFNMLIFGIQDKTSEVVQYKAWRV